MRPPVPEVLPYFTVDVGRLAPHIDNVSDLRDRVRFLETTVDQVNAALWLERITHAASLDLARRLYADIVHERATINSLRSEIATLSYLLGDRIA